MPKEQVELIYYAVDQSGHDPALADGSRVRRELGIPPDAPVVGEDRLLLSAAHAALFPHWDGRGLKGHDVLLRAVPHVLRCVPDAKFVLVGCGFEPRGVEFEHEMWALAKTPGHRARRDLFPGERTDMPDMLAMFDVSVQCSLTDNLAGTVESLLMAKPMVVSDIPGFADTVLHEKTGLVVPADNPEALAAAIVRLLGDEALRRRLGEDGRNLCTTDFTLARAVDGRRTADGAQRRPAPISTTACHERSCGPSRRRFTSCRSRPKSGAGGTRSRSPDGGPAAEESDVGDAGRRPA